MTLSVLLALFAGGVNSAWAQRTLLYEYGFEDYNLAADGWTTQNPSGRNSSEFAIAGAAKKTGSYGFRFSSYSARGENTQYLISPELSTDNGGIVLSFQYAASSTSGTETFKVGYSTTTADIESFTWGDEISYNSTSWKEYKETFPSGTKYVAVYYYANYQYRLYVDDFVFEAVEILDGPALIVQGYNDGETLSFGMVNPGATQTLTLVNPGTEDVTVNIATTGGFTADKSQVTIAANKGTKTVTITAPDATANGTITFTPTATGVDAITLNLSCTIKDPNKVFIDFSDKKLPTGDATGDWTTAGIGSYTTGSSASSYAWDFSNGYAWYKSTSSSAGYVDYYYHSLVSPLMKFTEGEKLIFKVKKEVTYSTYLGYLRVDYTTDGSTWTAVDRGTFADADLTTEWAEKEVTIPATTKKIRFVAAGIALDDIYGGELSTEPVMKVTASDYAFGMIAADATTTFKIANTGKSALTGIEVTSSNAAFTISDVPTSVEPDATATVTVTMSAATKGQQEGTITISAPNQEPAKFNVSGYVADTELFYEDFSGNKLPDGWTNTGWTFDNGEATGSYRSTKYQLITPALTVESGEKMAIEVMKTRDSGCAMDIYVSKDGGDFAKKQTIADGDLINGTYKVFFIEGLDAGSYKIRFDANDNKISAVNGFHPDVNAPVMEMVTTGAAAFGKVTASAAKTYTVKNAGTGTLTVNIASDNDAFTVAPAQLNIAAGETANFTVTFNYTEGSYGNFAGNITVTPTYNEALAVTIAASAKATDPNAWDEDFEEDSMPIGWVATDWSVGLFSNNSTNDTQIAKAGGYGATIITPRLQANKGDVLVWEALFDWYDEGIKVEYSDDEKASWKVVEVEGLTRATKTTYGKDDITDCYIPNQNNISSRGSKLDMQFIAPADGYYYLRFTSSYSGNGVDNFNGFKLAPKDHDAVISTTNIRSTFYQYGDYNVSVTVKEMVGKDEELTAKFFVGDVQYGEAVTGTVPAGGEKDFVITVRFNDLVEGDAYIVVSNDNIELTSNKVAITTKAAVVLDEAVAPEGLGTGYQDKVVVKYTAKQGWNTICMPFALTDDDLTALFGEGWKVYEFYQYKNGELGFREASRRSAGYPYIVYCENVPTIEEPGYILTYVSFTTEKYDEYSGAKFQGTFTPMAEGTLAGKYGVTPDGKIRKGGAGATMPGFRGYFELPADAPAPTLSFTDESGETTYIRGIEAEQILKGAYNLQGQPVDTPTKGVYIINGKKVVIK